MQKALLSKIGSSLTRLIEKIVVYATKSINFEVNACVFRYGPLLSTGTASASSRNPLFGFFRHVLLPQELTVLSCKHYVSEENTRRLLRESEDDETPQRAFFASEEAHREPAESVVYFRSGNLSTTRIKSNDFFVGTSNRKCFRWNE